MIRMSNRTRKDENQFLMAALSRSTLAAAFLAAGLGLSDMALAADPNTSDAARQKYLDILRGTQKRLETEKLLDTPTTPAYPAPYYPDDKPDARDRMRGNLQDRLDGAHRTMPKPKTTTTTGSGSVNTGATNNTGTSGTSGNTGDAQSEPAEVTACRAYLETEEANAVKYPGYLNEPADGGRVTKMAEDGEVMTTTAESRASVRQKIADCEAMVLTQEELDQHAINRAATCELKRGNLVTYGSDPAERENYDRVKAEMANECPDVVVETCVDKYNALDASRGNLEVHGQLFEEFQVNCPKYGLERGSVVTMVSIPGPIHLPTVWDIDISPVRYMEPNGAITYEGSYSNNSGTTFSSGRYAVIVGNENDPGKCDEIRNRLDPYRTSAPGDWVGATVYTEDYIRFTAKANQKEYNDHCRLP